LTATDKPTFIDVATDEIPTNEAVTDDLRLPPQLRQALDDLKSAVHSVNCFQTTSRFLDTFSNLNEQPIEVQIAVQNVARYARIQDDQAARDIRKAQAAVEALSNEDQHSLRRFYGEDLLVYLSMHIASDLQTDLSEAVNRAQITLFDIEHLHRGLARVRGVEAHITDVFSGLHCIQDLKRKNRDEESRLLEQRTKAERELCEQFLKLAREEQDLLWLWYRDAMEISGTQRKMGTSRPYSIRR
jgi:hypothetical protein